MYYEHFGLQTNPFQMTPDPAFLYLTPQYREAIASLTYAILAQKGFVVLTGEAGTGKTTLIRRVIQCIPEDVLRSSIILNPTLSAPEFLETAMLDFGLRNLPSSKALRLLKFNDFLIAGRTQRKITTLIIDEAHTLDRSVLEEIRLLSNFESATEKLLQIVLLGQPELDSILNREDLRQLKQRIALRMKIQPLAMSEVEQYMRSRWHKAGSTVELPFDSEAIKEVAGASTGIPRLINSLSDNALLLAFAEGVSKVTRKHVSDAGQELQIARTAVNDIPAAKAETTTVSPLHDDMPPSPIPRFRTLDRDIRRSWFWWRSEKPSAPVGQKSVI